MNYLILTKNKSLSKPVFLFFKKNKENVYISHYIIEMHDYLNTKKIDAIFIDQNYIKIDKSRILLYIQTHYSKVLFFCFNSKNLQNTELLLKTKQENLENLKLQRHNLNSDKALKCFENFLDIQTEQLKSLLQLPLRKKENTLFMYLYKNMPNEVPIESIIYHLWGTHDLKHKKTVYCYISRIKTICNKNAKPQINIINNKGSYKLKLNQ